jgi:hypothetical protein
MPFSKIAAVTQRAAHPRDCDESAVCFHAVDACRWNKKLSSRKGRLIVANGASLPNFY